MPRSRGVLAARPGDPGLTSAKPGVAPSADAPIRMTRLPPSTGVGELVRHYWIPRWRLPTGRSVTQRVLEYPTANLVVEGDEVAIHGPAIGLGSRTISGHGRAFGVLLQPGTATALLGVPARELVGRSVTLGLPRSSPTDPDRDAAGAVRSMQEAVRSAIDEGDDLGAVAAFETWCSALGLRPSPDAQLVRDLVTRAEEDRSIMRVDQLATLAGVGVRQFERIVREQLGLTPKWLIRRYRLQEAAERLAAANRPSLAELATELGYADQAHFTREFSSVIGVPPGRYLREADHASVTAGGPG